MHPAHTHFEQQPQGATTGGGGPGGGNSDNHGATMVVKTVAKRSADCTPLIRPRAQRPWVTAPIVG
eukprot:scaffold4810_cov112-Isochrysis_galbana.AAC.6